MPEYNIIETPIIPEMPKLVSDEVRYIYVPKVTPDKAGIASFNNDYFKISNGQVNLNLNKVLENTVRHTPSRVPESVYSVDSSGNDSNMEYSVEPTAYTMVQRSHYGTIKTNDPDEDSDAVSLSYFNRATSDFITIDEVELNNLLSEVLV